MAAAYVARERRQGGRDRYRHPQARSVIAAGKRANGIAVHPSGKKVYVSNGATGVCPRSTRPRTQSSDHPCRATPWNMAITPDDGSLRRQRRSNSVSVIDTEKDTKLTDIPVGELPWGVTIR